jgi:hypothetical protein
MQEYPIAETHIDQLVQIASIDNVVVSLLGEKGQSQVPVKLEDRLPEDGHFCIEVVALWTGWKRRQYKGEDVAACTEKAYTDFRNSLETTETEQSEEENPEEVPEETEEEDHGDFFGSD